MAGRAAIVGVGHTAFARAIPDKSTQRLRVEAAKKAADDAGVRLQDVDGLIIAEASAAPSTRYANPRSHMEFGEILGMYDKSLCFTATTGGAAPGMSLEVARWAVEGGRCKYVLILSGFKGSEAGRSERGSRFSDKMAKLTMHYPDYEHPYGPLMASFYATVAQRYMYEYGISDEQLASIPAAFRYNASLNPDAVYREPITVADVLDSRPISTPLNLLHCCMINDGAVAFLVTSEDRARDLKNKPVYVLGSGGGQAGYYTGFLAKAGADRGYSLTTTLGKRAAADAFREAGVTPADIDLVTCCDNFAITPMVHLEDYGFCGPGEAGAFIGKEGERIRIGGDLPVNPHGGSLSCSHAATNYLNYVEATRQLRGQAGERQVPDAKLAVASASAGILSTHYVQILGTD